MRHFTHRWPQSGQLFSKLGHVSPIFEKGQEKPPHPLPPSSYAPVTLTSKMELLIKKRMARHTFHQRMIKIWLTKSTYIYHKSNICFSNSSSRSLHNPIRTKKKTNIFNHRVNKLIWRERQLPDKNEMMSSSTC